MGSLISSVGTVNFILLLAMTLSSTSLATGSNGLSMATDPYGRVLAAMDHFTASERVMVAQVPTKGVFTLYSVIGDLFGWLAVVGFVTITIWTVVRWRKAGRARKTVMS